jgi:hypothetical protein
MFKKMYAVVVGLVAASAMFAAASGASAATIASLNQTSVTATGSTLTLSNSILSITCNLTLNATFNRSITLGTGLTQLGAVTSGNLAGCVGGTATLLGLPTSDGGSGTTWPLRAVLPLPASAEGQAYFGVLGAFIGVTASILGSNITCLYQGDTIIPRLNPAGNRIDFIVGTPSGANSIPQVSGGLCALGGNGSLRGSLSVSPSVTVTLSIA